MKKVAGYVRSIQTAAGIPDKTVTARYDDASGLVIPAGGMLGAGPNPVITDANGYFEWQTELSPGPMRIEADVVDGVEVKVNSGKETMQVGEIFLSDLRNSWRHLSDGVVRISDADAGFVPTVVTGQRQVTLSAGLANMRGRIFQTYTPRTLTFDANTTLANRIDRIVLEQHVGGDYRGRQNIAVIKGTVSGVLPASNADPNIFQLPIAEVTVALNASSVTIVDRRIISSPFHVIIPTGSVGAASFAADALAMFTNAENSWPGMYIRENDVRLTGLQKELNFGSGLFAAISNAGNVVNIDIASGRLIDIFPATHTLRTGATPHYLRPGPGTTYASSLTFPAGTQLHRFYEDTVTIDGLAWYYCYVRYRGFGWVGWVPGEFEAVP